MNPEKNIIFVIGMHRSGTSAVTRLVNLLGANLGNHLLEAMDGVNDGGFWENEKVVAFNEALFGELGIHWYSCQSVQLDSLDDARLTLLKQEASELIAQEFGEHGLIAIKDPRICRLLPFWLDVVEALNYTPHVIQVLRDPMEVAKSLRKRDGFPLTYGLFLWLLYTVDSLKIGGCSSVTVAYADVLSNWRDVASKLTQLQIFGPAISNEIDAELQTQIDSEISPSFRHQTANNEWATDKFTVIVQAVYQHLLSPVSGSQEKIYQAESFIGEWLNHESSMVVEDAINAQVLSGQEKAQVGAELMHAQTIIVEREKNIEWFKSQIEDQKQKRQYAESIVIERDTCLQERDKIIDEKEAFIQKLLKSKAYAESITCERDQQLSQLIIKKNYAESVICKRDRQLSQLIIEKDYAESVVCERDNQLSQLIIEKDYAESIVRERDAQLNTRNSQLAGIVELKESMEATLQSKEQELLKITSHPALKPLIKLFISGRDCEETE